MATVHDLENLLAKFGADLRTLLSGGALSVGVGPIEVTVTCPKCGATSKATVNPTPPQSVAGSASGTASSPQGGGAAALTAPGVGSRTGGSASTPVPPAPSVQVASRRGGAPSSRPLTAVEKQRRIAVLKAEAAREAARVAAVAKKSTAVGPPSPPAPAVAPASQPSSPPSETAGG